LVYSIHDSTEVAIQKMTEAIKKTMLDNAGKTDKGYFTPSDLAFHLMILPMTTWEYNKSRLAVDRLVKESKIVELES
jgi:DNA-binding FadR family transcriptional regulator